jgi:hypothetical protein
VRAPYVQSVIPIRGFRNGSPPVDPPVPAVPIARVHVRCESPEAESTRRSVIDDVSGNIALAEHEPERREGFDVYDDAFVQVVLPPGVTWGDTTTDSILDLFAQHDVGVVRAIDDDGSVIDVARTRAVRRAVQVRPDDDPIAVASQLFGVWWVDAEALDIARPTVPTPGRDGVAGSAPTSVRSWPRRAGLWAYDRCTELLRSATR